MEAPILFMRQLKEKYTKLTKENNIAIFVIITDYPITQSKQALEVK